MKLTLFSKLKHQCIDCSADSKVYKVLMLFLLCTSWMTTAQAQSGTTITLYYDQLEKVDEHLNSISNTGYDKVPHGYILYNQRNGIMEQIEFTERRDYIETISIKLHFPPRKNYEGVGPYEYKITYYGESLDNKKEYNVIFFYEKENTSGLPDCVGLYDLNQEIISIYTHLSLLHKGSYN